MRYFKFLVYILFLSCTFSSSAAEDRYKLIPSWLQEKFTLGDYTEKDFKSCVDRLQSAKKRGICMAYPKAQEIESIEYNGDTVYKINPGCCDQFTEIYSKDGNLLYQSGGFVGKTTSFNGFNESKLRKHTLIWKFDPTQDKKYTKEIQ